MPVPLRPQAPLQLRQQHLSVSRALDPGARQPLHWPDTTRPLKLCVRVQEPGWSWSGGVALGSGDHGMCLSRWWGCRGIWWGDAHTHIKQPARRDTSDPPISPSITPHHSTPIDIHPFTHSLMLPSPHTRAHPHLHPHPHQHPHAHSLARTQLRPHPIPPPLPVQHRSLKTPPPPSLPPGPAPQPEGDAACACGRAYQ